MLSKTYRYIFLVQNRNFWESVPFAYNKEKDLVLTFDFALKNEIIKQGGLSEYIDHLVDSDKMEHYNFETYKFFFKWQLDENGNDIFMYKGIETGNAFRLEIWNEVIYYIRIMLNLLRIKNIKKERFFVGINDKCVRDFLHKLDMKAEYWTEKEDKIAIEYYFPVFRWMEEKIYSFLNNNMIKTIKSLLLGWIDLAFAIKDKFDFSAKNNVYVFGWRYYPTFELIKKLGIDGIVKIVATDYVWDKGITRQRRLPSVKKYSHKYRKIADDMISEFNLKKNEKLKIEGIEFSDTLYDVILKKVNKSLPRYLKIVDSIIKFFAKKKLKQMLTVSNIGVVNCLVMNYCKKMDIPVYLIANGFFGKAYLNEAKEATWINSYGESMKKNYFSNMKNIVCLGDPRMDKYVENSIERRINTENPTIVIGAGGFSNVDLNSYVAFEFDFLNDILFVCRSLIAKGRKMNVVIKVRTNGYIEQYSNFVREYYKDIPIEIYDTIPMKEILEKADFYVSIYSQTLFEASCLGVPVLYYKKDTEKSYPPFNGKSELVTAFSVDELSEKFELFYKSDRIYDKFKDKSIMEKYIGYLDGGNLKRNIDFIYSKMDCGSGYYSDV